MLVICKHCLNSCKKFGKVDCNDYKTDNPDDWQKEYRKAIQTNPEKAAELKKKIDFFEYGVKY